MFRTDSCCSICRLNAPAAEGEVIGLEVGGKSVITYDALQREARERVGRHTWTSLIEAEIDIFRRKNYKSEKKIKANSDQVSIILTCSDIDFLKLQNVMSYLFQNHIFFNR